MVGTSNKSVPEIPIEQLIISQISPISQISQVLECHQQHPVLHAPSSLLLVP